MVIILGSEEAQEKLASLLPTQYTVPEQTVNFLVGD